jgi:hypothetical protein
VRKLSVIVRFHNEEKYLDAVLHAIRAQRCALPIEIVAVDNASTDTSRIIAQQYADTLLDLTEYRPGVALNRSIEACSGDIVVALSAHALPAGERWLHDLTAHLRNPDVLGVYGAQIYPVTSRFLDKKDLDIFSDTQPRTEAADSDFWNANAAFDRRSWEKQPFDETVIELEDHYWTKQLLPGGDQWVRFQPSAAVYHYGHEARNDRRFLAPGTFTDAERLDDALAKLADEEVSWPTAMTAGMTLGSLPPSPELRRAVPVIGRHLLEHPDFDVRWRMAGVLGRLPFPESVPYLVQGLQDRSFYARDECAWSLARLGDLAVPHTVSALDALDNAHLPFAALALGLSGAEEGVQVALDLIERCLYSGDEAVVRDALYFLGETGRLDDRSAIEEAVTAGLQADDYRTARAAVWCWGALRATAERHEDDRTIVELARCHPVDLIRAEAVTALGHAVRAEGSQRLLGGVIRGVGHDGAGRVRYAAMQVLRLAAENGSERAMTAAVEHTEDDDFGVLFERSLIAPVPDRT